MLCVQVDMLCVQVDMLCVQVDMLCVQVDMLCVQVDMLYVQVWKSELRLVSATRSAGGSWSSTNKFRGSR